MWSLTFIRQSSWCDATDTAAFAIATYVKVLVLVWSLVKQVIVVVLSTLPWCWCCCPSIVGPPIDKPHLPKVEVHWRRTCWLPSSPVTTSAFNLRYFLASSNNFVRRSKTRLRDSSCRRDSIRWSANSHSWNRSCSSRSILICCWPSERSFNDCRRGIQI